ncbi:MAG: hypothetical protein ACO3LB_04920 [Flavobacteriaceae bacterium]
MIPAQIVFPTALVVIVAIGSGTIDTITGAEEYSQSPNGVLILTVTESPSFNVPAAGVQFWVATPTGLSSIYHAIVSPGT